MTTQFTPIVSVPPLDFTQELLVIGDRAVFVEKMNIILGKLQTWSTDFSGSINSINSIGGEVTTALSEADILLQSVQSQTAEFQQRIQEFNSINGVTQEQITTLANDIQTAVAAAGGVVSTTGNQVIGGQKTFTEKIVLESTTGNIGIDITSPEGFNPSIVFNRNETDRGQIFYSSGANSLSLNNLVGGNLVTGMSFGASHIAVIGEIRNSVLTTDLSNAQVLATKSYVDLHARLNVDNTWTGVNTFTFQIKAPDGTSEVPALRFGNDDNIGWWRVNNQRLALKITNGDVMHWERLPTILDVITHSYGGKTRGHVNRLYKSTDDPGLGFVALEAPALMADFYHIVFPTANAVSVGQTLLVSAIDVTSKKVTLVWGAGSGGSSYNGGVITGDNIQVDKADANIIADASTGTPRFQLSRDGVKTFDIQGLQTRSLIRRYHETGGGQNRFEMYDDSTRFDHEVRVPTATSASDDLAVINKEYVSTYSIDWHKETGFWDCVINQWVSGHFDNTSSNNPDWTEKGGTGAIPVAADQWKMIGVMMRKGDVLDSVTFGIRGNVNGITEMEYYFQYRHPTNLNDYNTGFFDTQNTYTTLEAANGNLWDPGGGTTAWSGTGARRRRRTVDINYTAPEDGEVHLWVRTQGTNSGDVYGDLLWKINRIGTPDY